MQNKLLPLLTIITPTYNNAHEIDYYIETLKRQSYPAEKIELLFIDGGSKDSTLEKAKKYGVKVIPNKHVLAEPGVSIGMENAHGELMMVLATDNIFTDRNAIAKIVSVFENKDIYAALPKQNYDKTDSFLTRYHNTFTDPFNHFVYEYASNIRTFHKIYKTLIQNDVYDVYDFQSNEMFPMMSFSQGFTIRKNYRREQNDFLDDVTPIIHLIQSKKLIACVHSVSVYHHTIKDIAHFIKKQRWATQNALEKKSYGISHRYNSLSDGQKLRMKLWPLYAVTIVPSIIDTVVHLVKGEDKLWIYHPLECFLCAYANFVQLMVFLKSKIYNTRVQISRQ